MNRAFTAAKPAQRQQRSHRQISRYRTLSSQGFTLLELMVVIAIAGILVAIAAPSFQSAIRGSAIESARDALAAAVKGARGEALFQKASVTICPSADQATCSSGTNWNDGWIVFTDSDGDGVVDAGDDTILSVKDGFNNLRLGSASGAVTFAANGIRTTTTPWSSVFCDANTSSGLTGDGLQISAVGNVSYNNNLACP